MHLLSGILVLFAFLAAAHAETCAEATTCMSHGQNMKSASEQGDIQALCKMQKRMADCVDSALADCLATGVQLPAEALSMLQTAVSDLRKQYNQMCKGYESSDGSISGGNTNGGSTNGGGDGMGSPTGKIPETATCMEATKCIFDVNAVTEAAQAGRIQELCRIIVPSSKCLKSAYEDCKKNNVLPKDQLDGMSKELMNVESMLSKSCGTTTSNEEGKNNDNDNDGAMGINQTSMFLTIFTALTVIVARLF